MKSYLTEAELIDLQTSALHKKTPFAITGVSHGMFSTARHYGGARYNGANYIYHPATDELIRDDVLKWLEKQRKAERKAAKIKKQGALI